MKDKSEILTAINLLYRRWNAFESKLGKMGFPVLDFDYCPDPQNDIPQFQDRLEILSRLESLLDAVDKAPSRTFSNLEFCN